MAEQKLLERADQQQYQKDRGIQRGNSDLHRPYVSNGSTMELFKVGVGLVVGIIILLFVYLIYLKVDYYLMVLKHESAKREQEAFFLAHRIK